MDSQRESAATPFWQESDRIKREVRHAHATLWPEGDSWIRGYAEDCGLLLREIDNLHDIIGVLNDQHASDELKREAGYRYIAAHGRPTT